jgi:cobalamin-dependent methionine synthase I
LLLILAHIFISSHAFPSPKSSLSEKEKGLWYALTPPHGLQVDWKAEENLPTRPRLIGTKVYEDYPLEDVVDYIDWNPFFQVKP